MSVRAQRRHISLGEAGLTILTSLNNVLCGQSGSRLSENRANCIAVRHAKQQRPHDHSNGRTWVMIERALLIAATHRSLTILAVASLQRCVFVPPSERKCSFSRSRRLRCQQQPFTSRPSYRLTAKVEATKADPLSSVSAKSPSCRVNCPG